MPLIYKAGFCLKKNYILFWRRIKVVNVIMISSSIRIITVTKKNVPFKRPGIILEIHFL